MKSAWISWSTNWHPKWVTTKETVQINQLYSFQYKYPKFHFQQWLKQRQQTLAPNVSHLTNKQSELTVFHSICPTVQRMTGLACVIRLQIALEHVKCIIVMYSKGSKICWHLSGSSGEWEKPYVSPNLISTFLAGNICMCTRKWFLWNSLRDTQVINMHDFYPQCVRVHVCVCYTLNLTIEHTMPH